MAGNEGRVRSVGRRVRTAALGAMLFVGMGQAWAADGVSVLLGHGDHTDLARLSLMWDWHRQWFQSHPWHLVGYWNVSVGAWRPHDAANKNPTIWDVGVTPVFRLEERTVAGWMPYFEGAVGIHLLSHTWLSETRRLGSAFEFGDHVGFGVRFGPRDAYDLAYIYQHVSNAEIKEPNCGANFNEIRFAYHFH